LAHKIIYKGIYLGTISQIFLAKNDLVFLLIRIFGKNTRSFEKIPNPKHQRQGKFQIPSTKFQTNSKKQNPKFKKQLMTINDHK